jgi:hypothetical protein
MHQWYWTWPILWKLISRQFQLVRISYQKLDFHRISRFSAVFIRVLKQEPEPGTTDFFSGPEFLGKCCSFPRILKILIYFTKSLFRFSFFRSNQKNPKWPFRSNNYPVKWSFQSFDRNGHLSESSNNLFGQWWKKWWNFTQNK